LEPDPELELKPLTPLAPLPPVQEPGARPVRPPPEPKPEPHPTARWWYEWTYRGFDLCRRGFLWCLGFGLLSLLFLPVMALLGVGYVLLLLPRLVLLTFFFARFSLGQFMLVFLSAGFAVSLIVVLDGYWKALPALGLMLLFIIAAVYIGSYDPFDREKVLPRAAREVLFNPPDAPPRPAPVMDEEEDEPPPAPKQPDAEMRYGPRTRDSRTDL